jgi:ribonuclease HI
VKGHSNNPLNNKADGEAKLGRLSTIRADIYQKVRNNMKGYY